MLKLSNVKLFSYYWRKKIEANLSELYKQADRDQITRGKQWYTEANRFCNVIGKRYGYTPETVAHVVSALSPRNKWKRNLYDTCTVLKAVNNGLLPKDVKVCTFDTNKEKAFDIATGDRKITEESPKTFAFVQNIAHLNSDYITIDIWHLRAMFGRDVTNLIEKRYRFLEDLTIKTAKKYNVTPYEFQAIVWNVVREN